MVLDIRRVAEYGQPKESIAGNPAAGKRSEKAPFKTLLTEVPRAR